MKGVLEFDITEEKTDLERALKADSLVRVIEDYDNFLRGKLKYTEEETINLQEARDRLWEVICEHEVEGLIL